MANKFNTDELVPLLIELRARLLRVLSMLFVIFAACLYFANELYTVLAGPLLHYLPGKHLIATQLVSPFFVPFKLAFVAAFFLAVPFFLHESWRFISPALYRHEKSTVWPFLLLSVLLFYLGLLFAYAVIFPVLFQFLTSTAPKGVHLQPDISDYLDFTLRLLVIFGFLFEIPMVMWVLVRLQIVSAEKLRAARGYAFLGAFVLGLILAPPDVFSQTVLAIPIWLLYECGIFLCRFVPKTREVHESA